MAESVFNKPIDTAIQEINDKIGTVPSGETVEGQIDALNSKITTLTLRNINIDYTVSEHGETHTNLKTIIDNDIPAGYKYLGIAGYRTNNINIFINAITYLDSNYSLQLSNTASSSITNSINIQYLCIAY